MIASINAQNECAEFSKDIKGSLARMALRYAQNISENSVPRLTLAEAEKNNEYNRIMVNMKLIIVQLTGLNQKH